MTTRWHVKNVGTSPVTIDPWGAQPFPLAGRHNFTGHFNKKQVALMKANTSLKLERLRGQETDEGEEPVVPPAPPLAKTAKASA